MVSAGSSRISSNISEYIWPCASSFAPVSPRDRRTCHHLPDICPARPWAAVKTSYPQTHLPLRRQGSSPISTDFQERAKGESKRRRFRGGIAASCLAARSVASDHPSGRGVTSVHGRTDFKPPIGGRSRLFGKDAGRRRRIRGEAFRPGPVGSLSGPEPLLTPAGTVRSDGGQGFPNAKYRVWGPVPGMEPLHRASPLNRLFSSPSSQRPAAPILPLAPSGTSQGFEDAVPQSSPLRGSDAVGKVRKNRMSRLS